MITTTPLGALFAAPSRLLKSVRVWIREHVFWAILTCLIEFAAAAFGIYHATRAPVPVVEIFLPGGTSQVIHPPESEGGAVRLVIESSPVLLGRATEQATAPAQPIAPGTDPVSAADSASSEAPEDRKPRLEDYLHEVRSQGVPLAALVDEADPQGHSN